MSIDEIQDKLSSALQSDMEHGVSWLNDKAWQEWHTKYPQLAAAISEILGYIPEEE